MNLARMALAVHRQTDKEAKLNLSVTAVAKTKEIILKLLNQSQSGCLDMVPFCGRLISLTRIKLWDM